MSANRMRRFLSYSDEVEKFVRHCRARGDEGLRSRVAEEVTARRRLDGNKMSGVTRFKVNLQSLFVNALTLLGKVVFRYGFGFE